MSIDIAGSAAGASGLPLAPMSDIISHEREITSDFNVQFPATYMR